MPPATTPEIVIRETLPLGAQWGLLGILLALALVAVVVLVVRAFRVEAALRDLHKAEIAALNEKRLKESADYAGLLAELGEQMASTTDEQAKAVENINEATATLAGLLEDQRDSATGSKRSTRGGPR